MKHSLIVLSLSAVMVSSAYAATDSYTIDPHHAFPIFEVSHLGFSTQRGRFDETSGKVTLDFAAKTGSVALTINTKSLDMGFPLWNEHVSDGFFHPEKFPTMTYKSTKLIFEGDKVVAADGDFTLLGVTKPLRVTVTGFHCGVNPMNKKPLCAGDVSATFKRSDYGMMTYLPAIGDDIKINVPIEAYKD